MPGVQPDDARAVYVGDGDGGRLVGEDGVTVTSVETPGAALRRLDRGHVDCIVCEHELPNRDGRDLLDAVRSDHPRVPVVLLTGQPAPELDDVVEGLAPTTRVRRGAAGDRLGELVGKAADTYGRPQWRLARHETILEALGDFVYALDPQGRFTFINRETAEVLGYEVEELLGEHVSTILDEEAVGEGEQVIADLLESGQRSGSYEADIRTARGSSIPCEINLALLPGEEFEGTAGVARDFTERRVYEQTLRRERDRFTALFESVPEPVVHVRFRGDEPLVRNVNSAFEDVFGHELDDAVGRSLNDLVVPEGREVEAREIDRMATEVEEIARRVERRTPEGNREFLFRARPFDVEDGVVESIGIYVDISGLGRDHDGVLSRLVRHI